MDPQQRHLLEVSYEALENAGVTLSSIAATNVGVFIGASFSDYRTHMFKDLDNLPMFEAPGNAESLLSNRISYMFDLRGPSLTIDTACSSSLVALNTAFKSLQAGESSAAIVAASHLNISPEGSVTLSTTRYGAHHPRRLKLISKGFSLLMENPMLLMIRLPVDMDVARVQDASLSSL